MLTPKQKAQLTELLTAGFKYPRAYYLVTNRKSFNFRRQDVLPEFFPEVTVLPDKAAKYGWRVIDHGKERQIFEAKGTCRLPHLYTRVTTVFETGRTMSLAALIWLTYMHLIIPQGYVIDHFDEDPMNNDPMNLQCITVKENTQRSAFARKLERELL